METALRTLDCHIGTNVYPLQVGYDRGPTEVPLSATPQVKSNASPPVPSERGGFRADIEGLRALAVGLVILYHIEWKLIPGGYVGVDVFFVISGFLITGLILREIEKTGRLRLARFYARRIRRLLPASIVALIGIALITLIFLPSIRWGTVAGDITSASAYLVNWRFAGRAVDYLAEGQAASPVLHFWSLAVEEQFYLVWPLVMIAVTRLKPAAMRIRTAMLVGLAFIAVPSLLWSIYQTAEVPGRAYFVTTTRMWELAVGGFLAILVPWIPTLSRRLAAALGLGGLSGIVYAAAVYDAGTAFPGYTAMLPVLATAVVVAAGAAAPDNATARMLGIAPLRFIGGMSYSLYLWHWPAVVAASVLFPGANTWILALGVAASFAPAWIFHQSVENPIRKATWFVAIPRRAILIGVALTLTGILTGVALGKMVPTWSQGDVPSTSSGPLVFDGPLDVNAIPASISPDPAVAKDDIASVYDLGCHQNKTSSDPIFCEFGDAGAELKIALVGDSHAAQWVPTFEVILQNRDWLVRSYTKSGCLFADVTVVTNNVAYEGCTEWNNRLVDELADWDPDYVVTSGFHLAPVLSGDERLKAEERETALAGGYERAWSRLTEAGLVVIAIQDPPTPGIDVAECVSINMENAAICNVTMEVADAFNGSQRMAAANLGVQLVDLTDRICTSQVCPAVVGEILVWRGANHLTATYARLLAPYLDQGLEEAMRTR